MKKFKANLIKNQVSSNTGEAQTLKSKSNLGEKSSQKIIYSNYEALYLLETGKIEIFDYKENPISQENITKKFTNLDKNFEAKYQVFKDLTSKGYSVKTALKFGTDFRIYEKSSENSHSKWLCLVTKENQKMIWQDFTAKARVANSSKKNLLLAILDEENSISYYETSWIKPQKTYNQS